MFPVWCSCNNQWQSWTFLQFFYYSSDTEMSPVLLFLRKHLVRPNNILTFWGHFDRTRRGSANLLMAPSGGKLKSGLLFPSEGWSLISCAAIGIGKRGTHREPAPVWRCQMTGFTLNRRLLNSMLKWPLIEHQTGFFYGAISCVKLFHMMGLWCPSVSVWP